MDFYIRENQGLGPGIKIKLYKRNKDIQFSILELVTLKFTLGPREWLGGGRTRSREKRQETLVFMDRETMGLN